MLGMIVLVIILFVVSFLETGVSLTAYSEKLLYVPESGDEDDEIVVPSVGAPAPEVSADFKAATTDAMTDADEMLERIYSGG